MTQFSPNLQFFFWMSSLIDNTKYNELFRTTVLWFLLILILYLKHFSVHLYHKYHSFLYVGYLYLQILDKMTIWVSFVVEVVKVIWENISKLVLWGLHKIFIQTPTNISIRNNYWEILELYIQSLRLPPTAH